MNTSAREPSPSASESNDSSLLEQLRFFVSESNRIEGINRDPTTRELQAHADLLARDKVTVCDLQNFVEAVQPGKRLRDQYGMNVRVGQHVAPAGGPGIAGALGFILDEMRYGGADPWTTHVAYETLHPFMDGNGRSGRALWLWQMTNMMDAHHAVRMGFLHLWYYQTLQHSNRSVGGTEGATQPTVSESSGASQVPGPTT